MNETTQNRYVGVHFYHVPCKDSWQRAEFLRYLDKELSWYAVGR